MTPSKIQCIQGRRKSEKEKEAPSCWIFQHSGGNAAIYAGTMRHKEGAAGIVPATAGARRGPISARSAIPAQHQQCRTNFHIASSCFHYDAISPVASCLASPCA